MYYLTNDKKEDIIIWMPVSYSGNVRYFSNVKGNRDVRSSFAPTCCGEQYLTEHCIFCSNDFEEIMERFVLELVCTT